MAYFNEVFLKKPLIVSGFFCKDFKVKIKFFPEAQYIPCIQTIMAPLIAGSAFLCV